MTHALTSKNKWYWCSVHKQTESEEIWMPGPDCLLTGPFSTEAEANSFAARIMPTPASEGRTTDAPKVRSEFVASWKDWEGAVCVTLEDYERAIAVSEEKYAACQNEYRRCTDELAAARRVADGLRSATAHGEGYPGIAHDFETMRTALCAIVGLSNVHHDLESAQEIASNAVRDLRSVDRGNGG